MRLSEFNISETVDRAIAEHIKRGVPFTECMFRPGSEAFTMFYQGVREMRESIDMDWFDSEMLDTDIGECIEIDGEVVPLDVPMEDLTEDKKTWVKNGVEMCSKDCCGKPVTECGCGPDCEHCDCYKLKEAEYQGRKVKLNSPKRGGSKKYYVYTKNKKGNVIKVSWGDTTGLKTKANNPGAVKSFVARHDCKNKKDKTKAGYWACRTPRYKSLGVKGGQWW